MMGGATLSNDGQYRYRLSRRWQTQKIMKPRVVTFIMLNPSTADATNDDPTIKRCISFAQGWGYDGLEVTNLFGLRTVSPLVLKQTRYPVGREWLKHFDRSMAAGDLHVAAWGNHGSYLNRSKTVVQLCHTMGYQLKCLTTTASGEPGHPLYLPNSTELKPYGEMA